MRSRSILGNIWRNLARRWSNSARGGERSVWRRRLPLSLEQLEDRTLLSDQSLLPPAIVVGRALSSYFVGGVQNNQETITYTVYNEQANPEAGVLLTDTLQPGVTFASASQLPDQSGQKLAWSLGTIQGFDRASVTLTVSLPATIPLQHDSGAQAFAMLDGASVSNSTPAATLRPGNVSDPSLLASTPDANTTDPFVQEQAAKLNYDPQQIFDFLHNDIGYNSYTGSLRGARGTLWSSAGNALDVASLGVALMRASGIPAQYEAGTLSQGQAQPLILSMFPARYQTAGTAPSVLLTGDPANSPQLLSETEAHYWFQFDAGTGMKDADPLMAGATIGQAFTTSTGTFAEVPDSLREKTEIKLTAEMYTPFFAGLIGALQQLSGGTSIPGTSPTVVLDKTFNDVDLVGRPLTIANFVTQKAVPTIFSPITNTYTPYIVVGDDALHDSQLPEAIVGQQYQEILSGFPLANQVLTGLFLDVTLTGPAGDAQTYSRTLMDRFGYAARLGLAPASGRLDTSGPPPLSDYDAFTLNVLASSNDPQPLGPLNTDVGREAGALAAQLSSSQTAGTAGPLVRNLESALTRLLANQYLGQSDAHTQQTALAAGVTAYYDRPRIVLSTSRAVTEPATQTTGFKGSIDLVRESMRVLPGPGQPALAALIFNTVRGLYNNITERNVAASLAPAGRAPQVDNTFDVFEAAAAQGTGFTAITGGTIGALQGLAIPAEAKARITADVQNGFGVLVPNHTVTINGVATTAWLEVDQQTGESIGVTQDGGHQGAFEFLALSSENFEVQKALNENLGGILEGFFVGAVLRVKYELLNGITGDPALAREVIKEDKKQAEEFVEKLEGSKKSEPLFPGLPVVEFIADIAMKGAGKVIGDKLDAEIKKLVRVRFKEMLDAMVRGVTGEDPPFNPFLSNLQPPGFLPSYLASASVGTSATSPSGAVQGTVQAPSLAVSSASLAASWNSSSVGNYSAASLAAAGAVVTDSGGKPIGSGAVSLSTTAPLAATVSGDNHYSVNGAGSLSFYGPAESSLGVSGNWDNYSATVAGTVSITLTSNALTLNGRALPAGTYTITTNSATLSGSGPSMSPSFSGSAAITAADGTLNLGPGTGNVTIGGKALDTSSGATLTGFGGSIAVLAGGGNSLDNVTLNGNAANVLTVSATPETLTADENTSVTFQAHVNTSFADNYNLTVRAPAGWTVTIDTKGNVSATSAPGLQSATYPILVIAQSAANPDLVAQTTVNVAVTPTAPGLTLAIQPDPMLTVPFDGAQLPTAFQAVIHNSGPVADTFNLSFFSVPSGLTILNSGTTVTIPAGQAGIVGIYLQPSGSQLPAPGTDASFTIAATSTTKPAIAETQAQSFTIPAVDAVNITSDPSQVTSTPGTAATATLTLTNDGNVPENVTLAAATPTGLTVSGLTPLTLAVGQTTTETISLTPATTAALNNTLQTTITATFGTTANPQASTAQVALLVRSPQTVAISQATVAASQANNNQLSNVLSELADSVSQLQTTPNDATLLSRVQFLLGNLSTLLSADPALTSFVSQLLPIQAKANSGDVAGMLALLPTFFSSLSGTLSVEASQQFSVSLSPNYLDMQTGGSHVLQVQLTNVGNDPVPLTLATPNLPAGMTASFSNTHVTLAVGATDTETLTLTATTLANKVFTLDVSAAASLVQRTATAVVAVRQATADVLGVTTTPQTISAGSPVALSAQVFNTANVDCSILVHVDVLDNKDAVVKALPDMPDTLVPGTDSQTLNLGQLDTTGLANGIYYAKVSLRAADGTPLPGHSAQSAFEVGLPVTASIAAGPTLLPPGTSTVTATISVANDDPIKWISSKSGNWDVAANWLDTKTNTHVVPGSTDSVTIDVPGVTVTVEAGNQAALGLQVAAGSTLAIANGTSLALGGPSEIDGSLTLSGTLDVGGGILTLKGASQWNDGGGINLDGHTLTNIGTIILTNTASVGLYANGFFNGSGGGELGGRLANSGTIVQQGAGPLTLFDSVGLDNLATGRYAFTGDGSIAYGNDSPVISNTGTIIKTGGSGVSSIHVPVDNRGTVGADSGTLNFASSVSQVQANQLTAGNWIARGGATLTLPGGVAFSRANLTLDGAGSKLPNVTGLAQNLGTFTISHGANFTTAGNFSNSGAVIVGPDSTLKINGTYTQTGGATLDIELGGTPASGHFGKLAVTGSASLSGMFLAPLVDGYSPAAGDSFTVATTGGSGGSFSPVYLPQTGTASFQASFSSNNIVLNAQAATLTPTSLTLASSAPNGANWGDETTFTATVAAGSGTPTGSVQFLVDGTTFGTPVPLTGGSASFTTSLELGQHIVTAFYLSDNTTFANSDDSANPLTQVINLGPNPPLVVQVGYADGLRDHGFFPNPWKGSPNTTFVGNDDSSDSGAILITNNSALPITVNDVSVTRPDGVQYDLWGSNIVPAGGNLILTQTSGNNFDSSDFGTLPYPQTYADGEAAHATHVDITVNGVLLPTFVDTGHVLTTGGSDLAAGGLNESQNWRLIGTTGISNPGGTAATVVVTHNLPASGYTVDPSKTSPGPDSSSSAQVVWNALVLQGVNASEFQVSGTVTNMTPGEVRQISTGTTVAVTTTASTGQRIPNTISLPALTVAAEHIISLTPPVQTVDRNATATYTVTLFNPLPTDVTYQLSLDGLGGMTVTLPSSVAVPAGQTVTVPLQVSVPAGAIPCTQVFEVQAQTAAGAQDAVEGQLTVAAEVALPSLAVHLALTPPTVTAGQGTSAVYTVAVTNVGEATDTYNLAVTGLPPGITASFSPATITVPPGASNFRDVTLILTPAPGTAAGSDPFTVTATSQTRSSVQSSAPGTLKVVSQGVSVALSPTSGTPGSTFHLMVTNTGTAKDTFDLSLGGPGALVAKLAATRVTLAAGASTTVTITTSAINFASPGALQLVGAARSEANPAVAAGAAATIQVPGTKGLAAHLTPGVRVLPVPGTSDFLLLVNNVGNLEDAYSATIMGTSGPFKAQLMGLDGLPTQTVPIFRLPGLATGALLLHTNLGKFGKGTVTVAIDSLSDPTIHATALAAVSAVPALPRRRGRAFG
jgi:uncharacterized membrane protein